MFQRSLELFSEGGRSEVSVWPVGHIYMWLNSANLGPFLCGAKNHVINYNQNRWLECQIIVILVSSLVTHLQCGPPDKKNLKSLSKYVQGGKGLRFPFVIRENEKGV